MVVIGWSIWRERGALRFAWGVVFVYTRRAVVPKDVVLVRIDPSVLVIPERAFLGRKKLKAIKLHDELCEIEYCAFYQCTALERITTI